MKRRDFLINSSIFAVSTLTAIGTDNWVARSVTSKDKPKRLIVIFLRGAVDGLSVVVPYSEPEYYRLRSSIAIPKPGEERGALDLDGKFGLHPALASIMPLWEQKNLAFIHACGSPDSTRSHFDAQYYMETGIPGIKRDTDGWMNRLLSVLSVKSPIQAINFGRTTPRILLGEIPVANLAPGRHALKRLLVDRPRVSTAFDKLYNRDDILSQTYRQGKMARQALMQGYEKEMKMANNGAPLPHGFPRNARRLAKLIVKDPRIELAFMGLGGWDTHINQGGSKGQLANKLNKLSQGLKVLVDNLGSVYQDTTIIVMSEFGRTVAENGNAGTDHGHGNAMWVLGGNVRGGKVYGEWSGLDKSQLYKGRDLAINTDFRDVLTGVFQEHMGLGDRKLNQILPGYKPKTKIALIRQ
ncbi:MAG: DUF1501 domain-containing protein [Cyanobacteria bacterium P01_A01_bin.84]